MTTLLHAADGAPGVWTGLKKSELRFLVLIFAITIVSKPAAYVLLAFRALKSPRAAVEGIALTFFVTMINRSIGHGSSAALRWAVLFFAFVTLIRHVPLRGLAKPVRSSMVLCVWFAALSIAGSQLMEISLFKLFSFGLGLTVAFGNTYVSNRDPEDWLRWFIGIVSASIVVSLPLLLVPGLGFNRAPGLFNGVFSHPQTFAGILAPVLGFGTLTWLRHERPFTFQQRSILLLGWGELLLTGSRTGLLATLAAILVPILISVLRGEAPALVRRVLPSHPAVLALGFLLVAGAIPFHEELIKRVDAFVRKDAADDDPLAYVSGEQDQYDLQSRTQRIALSLANFQAHPWVGIGFGVPSNLQFEERWERDPIFGLPLSAQIEKAFLPSATLEEVGALGSAALITWLATLFAPMFRRRELSNLAFASGALALNLGEATLFSMGGFGLITVVYIAVARLETPSPDEATHEAPRRSQTP
ncbi:MAG: O-antigen ligase family protein [Deltaproteobacteria bacterium]|nr:O-antigen ligase family protein [Deltaproteobacteria bacterium]